MTLRTERWLQCDFGSDMRETSCTARYTSLRQKALRSRSGIPRSLRDSAMLEGWVRTDGGEDLCAHHAQQARDPGAMPSLFEIPELDQQV